MSTSKGQRRDARRWPLAIAARTAGAWGRLSDDGAPTRRERIWAPVLLGAFIAAVCGRHVLHGGLSADDWAFAENVRRPSAAGVFRDVLNANGARPVYAVYTGAVLAEIGVQPVIWNGITVAVAFLAAFLFFAVLRQLSVPRAQAWLLAALAAAFPFADATALWFAAGGGLLSCAAYFGGLLASLRGFAAPSRPARVALLASGAALYAVSVMSEEITAPVIAVTGVIYLLVADYKRVLPKAIVDVLVAVLVVALITAPSTQKSVNDSLSFMFHHAKVIASQGADVFSLAAFPYAAVPSRRLVIGLALGTVALGLWLLHWLPAGAERRAVRAGLIAIGVGALVTAAGWVILIPGALGYSPGGVGNGNRINVVAAFGIPIICAGLLAVAAVVMLRGRSSSLRLIRTWTAIGLALLLIGYVRLVERDVNARDAASAEQRSILSELGADLPIAARTATVFVTGYPGNTAGDIPVFDLPFDLVNALRYTMRDRAISAWPFVAPSRLLCGSTTVSLAGGAAGPDEAAPYDRAYLFSVLPHRVVPLTSQSECRRLTGE